MPASKNDLSLMRNGDALQCRYYMCINVLVRLKTDRSFGSVHHPPAVGRSAVAWDLGVLNGELVVVGNFGHAVNVP